MVNPLSGVLGEAWAMYRAHARHLITIAFVLYVVSALVQAVLIALLGVVGAVLAAVIGIITAFLLQAALVHAVEDVRDGRADLTMGATLQAAKPAVPRVAGASILAGLGIGIGLLLLILPGLFLLTIWCLIVPVIVLEGASVGASFSRSRQLVRGFEGAVFGTLVLLFLVLLGATIVLAILLAPLPQGASNTISSIVSGTLVSPFLAVVLTLGYHRLRDRHAGATGPTATYGVG